SMPLPGCLAGVCPTESGKAVLRGRGQVQAVRAERDAVDAALMALGGKAPVPQPLEVAPFPAAQVLRAVVEQLFHPTQVVGRHSRSARAIRWEYPPCRSLSRAWWRCWLARQMSRPLPAAVSTTARATTDAVSNPRLFRRANLRNRYQVDGGHASTGSSCK